MKSVCLADIVGVDLVMGTVTWLHLSVFRSASTVLRVRKAEPFHSIPPPPLFLRCIGFPNALLIQVVISSRQGISKTKKQL